ncbi:MAG TPA: SPOR domain-containing protein [Gammaproteobacteria bacterium]|nr:SPOR domain-containing protein [Gammaproteobacteria bacterium]
MLFGLGLGLVVALGVYLRGTRAPAPRSETAVERPAAADVTVPRAAPPEASDESRFDFYDILPQYEVVVPEVETAAGRDVRSRAVEEPGRYVLQAGAFTSLTDADRLQASLALLGVESRIQRVTVDDDVFHRVRVGPISDLGELNRIRRQLREARIEPLLIKVP